MILVRALIKLNDGNVMIHPMRLEVTEDGSPYVPDFCEIAVPGKNQRVIAKVFSVSPDFKQITYKESERKEVMPFVVEDGGTTMGVFGLTGEEAQEILDTAEMIKGSMPPKTWFDRIKDVDFIRLIVTIQVILMLTILVLHYVKRV